MRTGFARLLMSICMLLGLVLAPAPATAQAPPQVLLNGSPLPLSSDQQPLIMSGTTLVPMRAIFAALGAEVAWDSRTQTVTARKGDVTVVLQIGAAAGYVNGRTVTLTQPARLVGGRTYVPLRFVSEALGAHVGWDADRRIVTIDLPAARAPLHTYFADAAVEAAVRMAVGNLDRPLSAGDLARVTDLIVPAAGVADLAGMEALVNLRRLHLPDNRIRDITPLANLGQLADLDLSGNPLAVVQPAQVQVTLEVRRTGYLLVSAPAWSERRRDCVGPGTYTWTVDGSKGTASYANGDFGGGALGASPPNRHEWQWSFYPVNSVSCGGDLEPLQSARLGYAAGSYTGYTWGADLKLELKSSDGSVLGSMAPLAGLTNLTSLSLDNIYTGDHAVLEGLRRLTQLRLVRKGAARDERLPALRPYMDPTAALPRRVETAHGVFLGDGEMSIVHLLGYANAFEHSILPELARDTGLRPEKDKTLFQIYGSRATWDADAGVGNVYGFYSSSRLYMAHWLAPDQINTVLLAHEYLHWLVREVGHAELPVWFDEGLAHNEAWRVYWRIEDYANPFLDSEWSSIVEQDPGLPPTVPVLASYNVQDAYVITAMSNLLQTHGGRTALARFFSLARTGQTYQEAFTSAFGISPDDYQTEYTQAVSRRRGGTLP